MKRPNIDLPDPIYLELKIKSFEVNVTISKLTRAIITHFVREHLPSIEDEFLVKFVNRYGKLAKKYNRRNRRKTGDKDRVTFTLNSKTHRNLRIVALQKGLSSSEMVDMLLDYYYDKEFSELKKR